MQRTKFQKNDNYYKATHCDNHRLCHIFGIMYNTVDTKFHIFPDNIPHNFNYLLIFNYKVFP